MNTAKHTPLNTQIYSEASDWLVEFRSGDIDLAGREAFYAWLRTSPEHMRAYLELAAIWNEGAGLDSRGEFDELTLTRDAQAQGNVIPLAMGRSTGADEHSVTPLATRQTTKLADWTSLALAASIVVAVLGVASWFFLNRGVYVTGVGEQHMLVLADGSKIKLNAQSKIRVRYSQGSRSIALLAGQALFSVAKDKNRTFVVTIGDTRVRAVGTEFDIYRRASGTTVTVLEGRVAVSGPSAAATATDSSITVVPSDSAEILLAPREQAVVTTEKTIKVAKRDVSAATAWTQGRLVFQGTPLQEVVDEFNRYNPRRLIIRDAQLASLNVTGIFSSTDPASFLRFLETRPGVTVSQGDEEIFVSRSSER